MKTLKQIASIVIEYITSKKMIAKAMQLIINALKTAKDAILGKEKEDKK